MAPIMSVFSFNNACYHGSLLLAYLLDLTRVYVIDYPSAELPLGNEKTSRLRAWGKFEWVICCF